MSLSLHQQDMLKRDAQDYDQEIEKLTDNVSSIRALFQQMNEIVMQQGEIVDRIDYNIETAMNSVAKGKKQLVEAKELQEHSCAKWCIRSLISVNLFLAFFVFLHFTK